MTKRLILMLLLSCSPLWAATYYVDNCVAVGNDLNNGTSPSTAWLTINKVNTSKFNPGDSILFRSGCTWREQLTVPSSGAAGKPITFGAYGKGALPIISGAGLITGWTHCAGSIYYASYSTAPNQLFEDGARLTRNTVSAAFLEAGQWYLDTRDKYIWVYLSAGDSPSGHVIEASQRQYAIYGACGRDYVVISSIEADKSNYRGMYVCGGNGLRLTDVASLRSFDDGIRIDTGTGIVVTASTAAYDGANGFDVYAAPGILLDHLVAHDNSQLTGVDWTAGIKLVDLNGASQNMTVQYSQVYNNGVGQAGVRGAGIWPDTVGKGFTAKYNLVYGNNGAGIAIDADNYATVMYNTVFDNAGGGIQVFADGGPSMTGQSIYNNTVYGNGAFGIEVLGPSAGSAPDGCMNNTVENNIATGTVTGPNLAGFLGCENPGTDGSGNVYAYNDFGPQASNFIQWGGGFGSPVYESTYSAWETAAGNCGTPGCSHSVQAGAMFANTAASQFWLASGSPAIGAGLNLGSANDAGLMPGSSWPNSVKTGNQNAYGSGWEMGAFVYAP
jgi:hypothetical protein